ncbi:MAG: hypothetical protein PHX20_07125 [Candidatus Omnitrophica bacterium]|nr:hypothetical protein [Candidatus Omnitrophota bacterium]MDD5437298.1 hypothetical protein [Candidatus Omnitrophota bacterium]
MIKIKKKSLIVAFFSSVTLLAVLVLTLVGYVIYLEIKDNELKTSYEHHLGELKKR